MLEIFARFYLNCRVLIVKLMSIIMAIATYISWTKSDVSSPRLFLILLIITFIYPFFYIVNSIIAFILMIFAEFYTGFKEAKREESYSKEFYQDFKENENNNEDTKYKFNFEEEFKKYNQNQSQYQYKYYQKNSSQSYRYNDDYHKALEFYGLSIPFNEKQLKDKRKQLMKKYHPDNGGNAKDAEKVNIYFDILKKYAS